MWEGKHRLPFEDKNLRVQEIALYSPKIPSVGG